MVSLSRDIIAQLLPYCRISLCVHSQHDRQDRRSLAGHASANDRLQPAGLSGNGLLGQLRPRQSEREPPDKDAILAKVTTLDLKGCHPTLDLPYLNNPLMDPSEHLRKGVRMGANTMPIR